MSTYKKEKEAALAAVERAARITMSVQDQIDPGVLEKKDKSPVTVADFGSQAVICKTLNDAIGAQYIIGEEGAKELRDAPDSGLVQKLEQVIQADVPEATREDIFDWIDMGGGQEYQERFWTVDPVDGTKGFLRKDQYAISLALIVNGEICVGALCCPRLKLADGREGAIFIAEKGQGSQMKALGDDALQPVQATEGVAIKDARLCESVEKAHSAHDESARICADLGITAEPVRIDSQAKYATVAMGAAEVYLRLPRDGKYREKIWDHAGGVLVVTEAGGAVSDVYGRPLNFSKGRRLEDNIGVIVTTREHHQPILAAIEKLNIGRF